MIDIVGLLKGKEISTVLDQDISTVLFYESQECRSLFEEACRFEGMAEPAYIKNSDETIKQYVRESAIEVVVVELNNSKNVIQDMERISHLLPNHASVVVIGSEDAISTIRGLKAMGYYYLFWPITKSELIEFIKNVYNNRRKNFGLGQNRKAKRVAVWGTKGGVGASLFAAEIAKELSESRSSTGVVIDHDFGGGNLDIMLGQKQFRKRELGENSLLSGVDEQSALTLCQKINPMLSVLSIESSDMNNHKIEEHVRELSQALSSNVNFIIDDLSGSGFCRERADWLIDNVEIIVLVMDATVGSVRDAAKLMNYLKAKGSTARVVTVLNYTMPEKHTPLSLAEIEDFINYKVDAVGQFDAKASQEVLKGVSLFNTNLAIAKCIKTITSIILGEHNVKKKSSFWKK